MILFLLKFYNAIEDVNLQNNYEPTLFDVVEYSKGNIDISPLEEEQQKEDDVEPGSELVEKNEEQVAKPQANESTDIVIDDDSFDDFHKGLESNYESYEDIAVQLLDDSSREDNPAQIINVPDMDKFINIFPNAERLTIASELTSGQLK